MVDLKVRGVIGVGQERRDDSEGFYGGHDSSFPAPGKTLAKLLLTSMKTHSLFL